MKNQKRNNGQITLEYAVLIACLVGALLSMQIYLKRALQGRLRHAADELGPQYASQNTTGEMILNIESKSTTTSKILSEKELDVDLDGDGIKEDDVYGTEVVTQLDSEKTSQNGWETVGEF